MEMILNNGTDDAEHTYYFNFFFKINIRSITNSFAFKRKMYFMYVTFIFY